MRRDASMRERRTAARQKSFLRGCIYFNNRRHGDEIGVSFAPTAHSQEPAVFAETSDLGERMQKLEAEVAAVNRAAPDRNFSSVGVARGQ